MAIVPITGKNLLHVLAEMGIEKQFQIYKAGEIRVLPVEPDPASHFLLSFDECHYLIPRNEALVLADFFANYHQNHPAEEQSFD